MEEESRIVSGMKLNEDVTADVTLRPQSLKEYIGPVSYTHLASATMIRLAIVLLIAIRVSFTFTIMFPPISETTVTCSPSTKPRLPKK